MRYPTHHQAPSTVHNELTSTAIVIGTLAAIVAFAALFCNMMPWS